MCRKFRLVVFVLAVITLSACGGDSFNAGGGRPPETATSNVTFSVAGSKVNNNTQVIDDSGSFTLSWDVISSSTYNYSVFLSENSEFGQSDIPFFSGQCGIARACGDSADFDCSFDSANKTIACNGGAGSNVSVLLQAASPKTAYMFLRVTNEMQDSMMVSSPQSVQFEY